MPPLSRAALQRAAIHVPSAAALPVRFAADELRRYLDRMTGVELSIRPAPPLDGTTTVVLGADYTPVNIPPLAAPSSFVVLPEADRVTLAGGSPRALLDAVYAFLEQLGCRWSLHGSDEETVPQLSGALELAPIARTPPFALRGYCSDIMTWHYTQPEYFHDRLPDDRAFIDWMGKSGANAFFYIRHPFDTQLTIPELHADFARRGIDLEYGGHVLPLLLPRTVFAEHPGYFPQNAEGARTELGNLCTSSAAALATAAANAVQYVHEYPELRVLHIWGADLWHGGWCRCAGCAPLSAQDQSLRVCNAVARGLAAAGVPRPVCYLAYHDTIDADLTLRPEPQVIAEFAPRERCYGHALDDPTCATNRRYAAALERYVDLFDGRVRLFEYYGDAILFFGCAVPLLQVIAADLAYYQRLGIAEILMLQFGAFSLWAYPLNFLAFAARTMGATASGDAYCRRFGSHADRATRAFSDLENAMRPIVTYGDIRRPPRKPEPAAALLPRIETTIAQLAAVAHQFGSADDATLAAQASLVRYTHSVLQAVRHDLQRAIDGDAPGDAARYAEALAIVDAVDRRFKGLWGAVDLSIIHSFFVAAAHAE